MTRPARDPADPLVQLNVRVPESLRARVTARAERKDISVNQWVANACRFALQQSDAGTLTNTRGRTAPPPRSRQ